MTASAESIRMTTPKIFIKPTVMQKPDRKSIVDAWTPKTGIIEKIKKTPRSAPFVQEITPEMAMDILTLNDFGHNRDFGETHVEYIKGQMKSGDFPYTGATVVISETFKLLDGQHRLWSCWEEKKKFEAIIATGVEDRVFANIDLGKKRSAADAISISNYKTYSKPLANCIKNILLFKKKGLVRSTVSDQFVSVPEVTHFCENKKAVERLIRDLEWAKDNWMRDANTGSVINKGFFTLPQWGFVYHTLRTLPGQDEEARKFLDQFASGANLKQYSPIFIARKYFESQFEQFMRGKDRKTVQRNILCVKVNTIFEAWNLVKSNTKLSAGASISIDPFSKEIKKPISTRY